MKLDDKLIEVIAQLCHEANRTWSRAWGTNDVQPEWDYAPAEIRQSAIDGVKFVLQSPDINERDVHRHWMETRLAAGWKLGPKDLMSKTHPCLVPYEQLNSKERLKDHIFVGIVRAFQKEVKELEADAGQAGVSNP